MAYTIIRPADHQGWLAERGKGIGSSEVGTILGVNPWETPYQLWRRKKGLSAPVEENEAMRAGHILEGAVATYFEQESGRKVIKASEGDWLAVDKDREFLRVSPDRTYWLEGKHSHDNKGIVECKTTQIDISADDLPKHWYVQLQYQLGVMRYRQGSLAWLTRGRKFGYQDIAFDAELYAYMVERLEKFWRDCIIGDQEPPVTTIQDVSIKFEKSTGRTVEATEDILNDITCLKSIKPQIDMLEAQKKEIEDRIKFFMGDAESVCMAGSKESNPIIVCTWKSPMPSTKFAVKEFICDEPEMAANYMRDVQGPRRFLLK